MYFKFFDTFSYDLNFKTYEFVNLFKKITFSIESKNNKKLFSEYYISEGESLEYIADKVYGDRNATWLILMANDITNKNDFPQSLSLVEKNARNAYPGKSFYFYEYIPNLKAGDVLVKCTVSGENILTFDTTKYAVVQEYNKNFRYAIVNKNNNLSQNDIVAIKRLNGNNVEDVNLNVITSSGGATLTRSFATIRKITDAINSPIEFLNANSNYISPYYVNSTTEISSNCLGIYSAAVSDKNTIANTLIYSYTSGSSGQNVKTIFQQYIDVNNKNRILKLIKPTYAPYVIEGMRELLSDNSLRIKNIDIENNL